MPLTRRMLRARRQCPSQSSSTNNLRIPYVRIHLPALQNIPGTSFASPSRQMLRARRRLPERPQNENNSSSSSNSSIVSGYNSNIYHLPNQQNTSPRLLQTTSSTFRHNYRPPIPYRPEWQRRSLRTDASSSGTASDDVLRVRRIVQSWLGVVDTPSRSLTSNDLDTTQSWRRRISHSDHAVFPDEWNQMEDEDREARLRNLPPEAYEMQEKLLREVEDCAKAVEPHVGDSYLCPVCLENKANAAYLCGHMICGVCVKSSLKSNVKLTCYQCRNVVEKIIRLYC